LRAKGAPVLAGTAAEGSAHMEGVSDVDRGYEKEITSCIFRVHQFRDCDGYHPMGQGNALTGKENFDSWAALS